MTNPIQYVNKKESSSINKYSPMAADSASQWHCFSLSVFHLSAYCNYLAARTPAPVELQARWCPDQRATSSLNNANFFFCRDHRRHHMNNT